MDDEVKNNLTNRGGSVIQPNPLTVCMLYLYCPPPPFYIGAFSTSQIVQVLNSSFPTIRSRLPFAAEPSQPSLPSASTPKYPPYSIDVASPPTLSSKRNGSQQHRTRTTPTPYGRQGGMARLVQLPQQTLRDRPCSVGAFRGEGAHPKAQ